MMHNLDGYEECRALKQSPSATNNRIIMLTAMAQDFDRRKAGELGPEECALLRRAEQVLGVGKASVG